MEHMMEQRRDVLPAAPPLAASNRGGRKGVYAARGGGPPKRRRILASKDTENPEEEDAAGEDTLNIGNAPLSLLTAEQKAIRHEVAKLVRDQMRRLTGVMVKEIWPKWTNPMPVRLEPETGTPYLTPNFEETIRHPDNKAIIDRTVSVLWFEKHNPMIAHEVLVANAEVVTRAVLHGIAQTTWRGFKEAYKAQHSEIHMQKQLVGAQNARRYLRRKHKCAHLATAVPAYQERHGVDPSDLIAIELMSDDRSGPEDEGEPEYEWKQRMAKALGMTEVEDSILDTLVFFEKIKPNWHSDEYSAILHELWDIHWSSITPKQKKEYRLRVTTSGRSTNEAPAETPYDFGINKTWYEEYKDKDQYKKLLADWYKYPDPPGFGSHCLANNTNARSNSPDLDNIGDLYA
ncbi:hypothetical protein B0H21DRAFT_827486 [Amylocystis lapponica]|nr:hypothetical protein B0H21DRAFT_827486 [Amylocystis lapponica]